MKKMNKMYEAPKAEVVELNVNKDFMQRPSDWNASSYGSEEAPED
jgi:hypothetical protein